MNKYFVDDRVPGRPVRDTPGETKEKYNEWHILSIGAGPARGCCEAFTARSGLALSNGPIQIRSRPQPEYLGYFCTIFDNLKTKMEKRLWAISQPNFSSILCMENIGQAQMLKNSEKFNFLSTSASPGFSTHKIGVKFSWQLAQALLSMWIFSLSKMVQK